MFILKSPRLKGKWIQLEPLDATHRNELYTIAQDERIWENASSSAFGERFYRWFDKALNRQAAGQHLPFAVRRLADNKLIGSTRFYEINPEHRRLTIGYSWYIPDVWGSYVNPECKYVLLRYAFEDLHYNRVEFAVDARASRSRAAIKKLGAREEGTLRSHLILQDGYVRDTVVFSIIQRDWPVIKSGLETRLKALNLGVKS